MQKRGNNMTKKILMILTNTSELDEAHPTGVWLEEYKTPYEAFKEAGFEVELASPKGGLSPIDPRSKIETTEEKMKEIEEKLSNTIKLKDINTEDYIAVFFPGGHGVMMDLPEDEKLGEMITEFYCCNKLIGAVCHGAVGLINAKKPNGEAMIKGKKITAISNIEENMSQNAPFVPFFLEDKLKELGALYSASAPEKSYIVMDDNLITGQNVQSTKILAENFVNLLQENND